MSRAAHKVGRLEPHLVPGAKKRTAGGPNWTRRDMNLGVVHLTGMHAHALGSIPEPGGHMRERAAGGVWEQGVWQEHCV